VAQRVKIYVKRQIRLDRLSFQQRQMFKLGNVGLASRKFEIDKGLNANGGPAKPLTKSYAIRKSRRTKGGQGVGRNRRDLRFTGDMLREWSVRTVSERQAVSTWTTLKNRQKARSNERIESFISWSRRNAADVTRAGELMIKESAKRMVLEKVLNG
jgi:hypothetical protein